MPDLRWKQKPLAEVKRRSLKWKLKDCLHISQKVDLKDAVVTEVVPGTHKMTKVSILTNMDRFEKLKKNWKRLESVE